MKRLLVLTAVLTLTATTVGCRNCSWFRGALAEPVPTTVMSMPVCDPCAPTCCDPCSTCPQPGTCAPAGM